MSAIWTKFKTWLNNSLDEMARSMSDSVLRPEGYTDWEIEQILEQQKRAELEPKNEDVQATQTEV